MILKLEPAAAVAALAAGAAAASKHLQMILTDLGFGDESARQLGVMTW